MILIFFSVKKQLLQQHKKNGEVLNNMIKCIKQSHNIFDFVSVRKILRRHTKLCTSVNIIALRRHGPGKQAGKIANPFCKGAQCGIRPTVNSTNTSDNNNNRNIPQINSSMQQRNFNDQHAGRHDTKLMGKYFNSVVEQINRSSLKNPSGIQGITTTSATTQQEPTVTNEIRQRLYQEAVTPLQNKTSKEYPNPPKKHQVNMAKLNDEFKNIQAKQQPSQNNSDAFIKPSTIKALINNTKEPLTTQENNFRNNSAPVNNTTISNTESLFVMSEPDSDILPLFPGITTSLIQQQNISVDLTNIFLTELNNKSKEIHQRVDADNPVDYGLQKNLMTLKEKSYDQELHNYNNCLSRMNEEIKNYEKIKKHATLVEKSHILKKIKNLTEEYKLFHKYIPEYISRDLEEYKKFEYLLINAKDTWKNNIMKHLEQETIMDPRTYEQFIKEKQRCENASILLKNYGIEFPDIIIHELLRRAGVLINNDAMHEELSKTIKEGEGSSLHNQTYQIMSKNPEKYFDQDVLKLTPCELNDIFYNVNEGAFFLGIIKSNNPHKFIESGDEIHMNVITDFKRNNEISFYIGLGHLTSNKDSHTVKLTDKQYINKTIEDVNKTQCFRPYRQFIVFEKASVVIYDEGTSFVQSTNFKEINIRKIISDAVISKKQYLETNPIRQPNVMTKEKLQHIALELYQQNIDDMNKKIMDYNVNTKSQTPTKRVDENQLRQAQYDNNIKKKKNAFILRNAPQIYKDAYKLIEEIETNNKKQKENNINNKKKNEK